MLHLSEVSASGLDVHTSTVSALCCDPLTISEHLRWLVCFTWTGKAVGAEM